jgi:hypothetical protein
MDESLSTNAETSSEITLFWFELHEKKRKNKTG